VSEFVVGLTGGIGSGKSTVADLFVERGVALVDTDAIAHQLTAAGGGAMPALVKEFGPSVAMADGAMDRAAMRRLAFADRSARTRLEGVLHPLIRQVAAERCRAAIAPYVILAVPLLVESGTYRQRCDRVLVVDCPESLQIERVVARNGMNAEEVKAIIAAQASRQQRLAVADDVVVNDAGRAGLLAQVDTLHQKYLVLSAEKVKAGC
jgi:dephospho-CoA kinase